jgi:kinesin family protein 11
MQEALEEERRQSAEDRQKLMAQITSLLSTHSEAQETRIADRAAQLQSSIAESNTGLEAAMSTHGQAMDAWDEKEGQLLDEVKKSRELLKNKFKDDWNVANDHSTTIQNTTRTVHAETVRVVDEQLEDFGTQMEALDDFVTRAKSENASHHELHTQSVKTVAATVEQSFGNISGHFKTTFDRTKNMGEEMELDVNDLRDSLEPIETQLCQPLANLREDVVSTSLQEYQPTGETPQKVLYQYPTSLPRTKSHSALISEINEDESVADFKEGSDADNTLVFSDLDHDKLSSPSMSRPSSASVAGTDRVPPLSAISLREVNPNVTSSLTTGNIGFEPRSSIMSMTADHTLPLLKHGARTVRGAKKQGSAGVVGEGRENMPLSALSQSLSRRKSPRLN